VVEPERRHASLAELYVVPEVRGHRLLTVSVLAKNARAVRSYEGAGYAPYTTIMRRYL